MAGPKPPTIALSAKVSFRYRSLPKPVPIFPHRLTHSASGLWLGAMSRFSTLCRNRANLLYFDYAARATVLLPVIMANPINERCSCSACLHTCSTCCQNQISPLDLWPLQNRLRVQKYTIFFDCANFLNIFAKSMPFCLNFSSNYHTSFMLVSGFLG